MRRIPATPWSGDTVSSRNGCFPNFLGVHILRIIVFCGGYWGPLFRETTKLRQDPSNMLAMVSVVGRLCREL